MYVCMHAALSTLSTILYYYCYYILLQMTTILYYYYYYIKPSGAPAPPLGPPAADLSPREFQGLQYYYY